MTRRPAGSRLTAREREIANLLGLGLTNKEIAVRLKISQRTADTHVQNMLNKLGASNRAQIVALALETDPFAKAAVVPPSRVHALPVPHRLAIGRMAAFGVGAAITALLLSVDEPASLVTHADSVPANEGHVINDAFAAPDLDTSIWDVAEGPHLYVFQGGGRLAVYVGADAGKVFQAGVNTVCLASGDFDAQVSYQLVTWPKADALWVSLAGSGTPFNTYRSSREAFDTYGAYLPPAGREVRATGVTGKLRLARVGAKWSGYYLENNRWSWIASGQGPTNDVGIGVMVFNGDVATFGGGEALVYFRDFHLTAGRIVCA